MMSYAYSHPIIPRYDYGYRSKLNKKVVASRRLATTNRTATNGYGVLVLISAIRPPNP